MRKSLRQPWLLTLFAGASGFATQQITTIHRPAVRRIAVPHASLATTVAPALGAGLANAMFFSGLPEVLEKKRAGSLGDFNPMPMPIILGNTFGWLAYSLLTHDPYVAAANAPGLLLSSWYVMTTVRMADADTARKIERLAMLMATVHTAAGLACAFLLPSRQAMISLYGIVCNAILLMYYGAPLSTIGKVLKERSASSIYVPTVLLNGLNAAFWSTYALAIKDVWILVPNAIGFVLSGAQALLVFAFSNSKSEAK